jgi:hypothetical protein
MSTQIVPTFVDADDYQFNVSLENVTYGMQFTWNDRDSRWFMNFLDSSGNILVGSIPLVLSWPLLRQYKYNLSLPPGTLYILDTNDTGQEPGRYDLGTRCLLVYEESTKK